jgi:hypothetical protein
MKISELIEFLSFEPIINATKRPHPPRKMQIYAPLFEARREKVDPEAVLEVQVGSAKPCSRCLPTLVGRDRRLVLLEPHVGYVDLSATFAAIRKVLVSGKDLPQVRPETTTEGYNFSGSSRALNGRSTFSFHLLLTSRQKQTSFFG